MARRPLICGNWKMHCTIVEARTLVEGIVAALPRERAADVSVAPPGTALFWTGPVAKAGGLAVAAQNCHWEPKGAFTGEVSVRMIQDVGCTQCIVGHSERRTLFGETDETVRRKVDALVVAGVAPIVCVGESLEERDAGRTLPRVLGQVQAAVQGLAADAFALVVIAYEPIWAIGTGRNATPEQVQEVHAAIRGRLREIHGPLASETRILYGGSVKPSNAREILSQTDVDGALVGGASLEAGSFVDIVNAAS